LVQRIAKTINGAQDHCATQEAFPRFLRKGLFLEHCWGYKKTDVQSGLSIESTKMFTSKLPIALLCVLIICSDGGVKASRTQTDLEACQAVNTQPITVAAATNVFL